MEDSVSDWKMARIAANTPTFMRTKNRTVQSRMARFLITSSAKIVRAFDLITLNQKQSEKTFFAGKVFQHRMREKINACWAMNFLKKIPIAIETVKGMITASVSRA